MKSRIFKIAVAISLICLFAFTVSPTVTSEKEKANPLTQELLPVYGLTLGYIEELYLKELTPEQIKQIKEIQNETLSKIVSGLDKYSRYHNIEEWQEIEESIKGKFEGVGIKISIPGLSEIEKKLTAIIKRKIPEFGSEDFKNPEFLKAIYKWIAEINPEAKELHRHIKEGIIPEDGILIEEIVKDGPAEKTGLKNKRGWCIAEVDGKKLEGMALKDAVKLIKGPSGTKVNLALTPPKEERDRTPIEVEITRGTVETSVITGQIITDEIGYLKISDFYKKVDRDFKTAVENLKLRGMKKLILDLRNNPGGGLNEADKILEILLPPGRIEFYSIDRNGQLHNADSQPENRVPKIFSGKIAVLINGNSASASELVAISLKEQIDAIIIGKKSFGKGTIQILIPMPDGSALRLTTGHYLAPVSGEDIDGKGIIPDIEIIDNPETPEDEVILKAIEILKN